MTTQTLFPLFEDEVLQRINAFLASITPGFNTPEDIVPKKKIDSDVQELSSAIQALEKLSSISNLKNTDIISVLNEVPQTYDAIKLLLSLPNEISFRNGLSLTSKLPESNKRKKLFADLTIDVGLWEILSTANIESLIRIALIAEYSQRRLYLNRVNVEKTVKEEIKKHVEMMNEELDHNFKIFSPIDFSRRFFLSNIRRGIDLFIVDDDNPVAAIEFIFLTNVGGSQRRDLRVYYPSLQTELASHSIELILIADGQGFNSIGISVLADLFTSIRSIMTINQLSGGALSQALTLSTNERITLSTPIDQIIISILNSGEEVRADRLPIKDSNQSRVELARFVNNHPELFLNLSPGGDILSWHRAKEIRDGLNLLTTFDTRKVISLFSELLGAKYSQHQDENIFTPNEVTVLKISPNDVIPESFLVVSSMEEICRDLFIKIAKLSLQTMPNNKIAVLLTPHNINSITNADRQLFQSTLATNVVTVDTNSLIAIAKGNENSIDAFSSLILQQADLTKISPFIVHSATPRRMYFGRESEEATIVNTVSTNSVAILGSRRIGKTSLMLSCRESLEEAGFYAIFADAETVRNWKDFGQLANRTWGLDVPKEFEPIHLFSLIEQFRENTNKRIVILLDEIDQLLDWDMKHESDDVPEAFFRACRAISQEGLAQFVFSGERTIANKLWDPHSPHWNFCRPLQLQQLDRVATATLLIRPLESLGVKIEAQSEVKNLIWKITSGHPQIAQYLGDQLVKNINLKTPENRNLLRIEEFVKIANTFEYKEHYVTTYWGQATDFEKLLTLLIIKGLQTPVDLLQHLNDNGYENIYVDDNLVSALRMLELYGILELAGNRYILRAEWFDQALSAFGDLDQLIDGFRGRI